jgi:hypothetical protein
VILAFLFRGRGAATGVLRSAPLAGLTDLESPDHAYVVAPNKIDEDIKANLIKSIF